MSDYDNDVPLSEVPENERWQVVEALFKHLELKLCGWFGHDYREYEVKPRDKVQG